MSKDLTCDLKATKRLCDSMCLTFDESNLSGFIQKTMIEPFGFLLLSDIQVQLYILFHNI